MLGQTFKFIPSRFYSLFLCITLLASLVIISLLPLSIWLRILLIIGGALYGGAIFWRYALLRADESIVGVRRVEGGEWLVTTGAGEVEAVLRGDSTVTAIVSVLRFDILGRRRPLSCIIFKDSLAQDEYRRLVGAIRMGN